MDTTLLSPFYANDAAFNGPFSHSAAQLRLLMDWGPDRGYFLKPSKSIFISDHPEDKEAAKRGFEQAGLNLNYVGGSRYLGAYLGPKEEI